MKEKTCDKLTYLIAAIVIILFVIFLSGCKSQIQYIPVETVKTEWRDNYVRDSIFEKESVNIYHKGDTVFVGRDIYKYKEKIVRDSVYLANTIQVPYPVNVIKEVNRLKWYQEASVWFTKLVLVALALYLGVRYRKKIFAFIRKLLFKI